MKFDPNNKVVKLCADGMQLEAEGKTEEAHSLFQQAWTIAENDFEAFTAAHYLARNQKDPIDVLKWNIEALHRANVVKDDDMLEYYPSLFLNIGKSYENLQDLKEANNYYQMAANSVVNLPPGKYSDLLRMGIAEGLKRTGTVKFNSEDLNNLIGNWCERKELRPLSLILPAFVSNLGTSKDSSSLISALSFLSATKCLNEIEQGIVEKLIVELSESTKDK